MKMRFFTTSVLMCVMLFSSQSFARNVYVKLASDATAWTSVTQDAENIVMTLPEGSTDFAANVLTSLMKGDEVWVAKGVYTNSGKLALIDDPNNGYAYGGVALYGGFAGNETALSQRALSDKDGNGLIEAWEFTHETNFRGAGNTVEKASGFQLIHLGQNSVLDGVTISDNYYIGSNQASGGVVATTTTIRNCIIRDLTTETATGSNGGGLYVTGGKVESCLFETCTAASTGGGSAYGGGLLIYGIADSQAGVPTGSIKNSVIRNCKSGLGTNNGRGGGLFGKGGVIVENCAIYNNSASNNGGAFYFHNNGDANKHVNRIIGSTIVNNCSPYSVFPECDYTEMYNTVIWGNSATDYPNVDGTGYDNTLRLRNTTSAIGSSALNAYPFLDGIAINGTIQNPANIKNGSFTPILLGGAFNDVSGNPDPNFKNPTEFQGASTGPSDLEDIRKANWTLQASSLLINAGVSVPTNTNSHTSVASLAVAFSGVDIRGNARTDGSYDIGAYEFGADGTGISDSENAQYVLSVEGGMLVIRNVEEVATISLYNVNGILISSAKVSESTATLPLSGSGVYVVVIKNNSQVYTQKIVY